MVLLRKHQNIGRMHTWQPSSDHVPVPITESLLKRFDTPDEVRLFEKGRFECIHLGTMTLGRATYEPGWKWSRDVGAALGQTHCSVEHTGMVLQGHAVAAYDDGRIDHLTQGTLFYIPPVAHDSWVVGDEPYVSIHFGGAEHYAT